MQSTDIKAKIYIRGMVFERIELRDELTHNECFTKKSCSKIKKSHIFYIKTHSFHRKTR